MNGNNVSWVAFPAICLKTDETIGHVVVMNRRTSRSIRLVPFSPLFDKQWWKTTGNCLKDGNETSIPDIIKNWGLKPLTKDGAIRNQGGTNPRALANMKIVSEETLERSGGFIREIKINWPIFRDGEMHGHEEIVLTGDVRPLRDEAPEGWWNGQYSHIFKVINFERPEAMDRIESEDEILAALD